MSEKWERKYAACYAISVGCRRGRYDSDSNGGEGAKGMDFHFKQTHGTYIVVANLTPSKRLSNETPFAEKWEPQPRAASWLIAQAENKHNVQNESGKMKRKTG